MNKQTKFFLFAVIALGIFILVAKLYWKGLENKNLFTYGIITDCHWGGRGSAFYIVEYDFYIGKKYTSSYQLKCKNFGSDILKKRLVGLHVPIVYNPDKPWINTIVIEKEAFKQYNITIPVNLISITDFLDCK